MVTRWKAFYGEHPLHLLVLLGAGALAGYAVLHVLANPLWPGIALWFAAAIVAHDLIVFPAYAAADRVLHRLRGPRPPSPAVNYVRLPLMAVGLTFLLFFPGILRSGAGTYQAATGLTQEPFLARWLLLCAAFCATSLLVYAVRRLVARRPPVTVPDVATVPHDSRPEAGPRSSPDRTALPTPPPPPAPPPSPDR